MDGNPPLDEKAVHYNGGFTQFATVIICFPPRVSRLAVTTNRPKSSKHARAKYVLISPDFLCTRALLPRVLGEQFTHWLMSDGYWANRHFGWHLGEGLRAFGDKLTGVFSITTVRAEV